MEVSLGLVDGEIDIVVRDSGAGVPPGMEREVFRRGISTKDGTAGDGRESGGSAVPGAPGVHPPGRRRDRHGGRRSTFTATLPAPDPLVVS